MGVASLADPLRWHEFAPAGIYRQQIGDGPPTVGTRWEATDLIGPFLMRFVDELVELETNRRVVWYSSAPWNARVEDLCEPDTDGGTSVRARYVGNISGWLRMLVGWLPTPRTSGASAGCWPCIPARPGLPGRVSSMPGS